MAFERACALDEVEDDEAFAITLGGIDVAVARDGEGEDLRVYALQDLCSHQAVPLSEGEVADCQIECFMHGSMFDLRTGKPTNLPATEPVSTFPVELRDGAGGPDVYVDVSTPLNGVQPT